MTRASWVLIGCVAFTTGLELILPGPALTQASGDRPSPEMQPYIETIPGSKARFEMVPIPAGTFAMGSPAKEPGRANDEGPQHEVTIRAFWMQALEVTWDEYDLFAFSQDLTKDRAIRVPDNRGAADAVTYPTPPYADESFGFGKGKQPAISMTQHAAMEYCRWLSAKTRSEEHTSELQSHSDI